MSIECGDAFSVASILRRFLDELADDPELLKRYLDDRAEAIDAWFGEHEGDLDPDAARDARRILLDGDFQAARNLFGEMRGTGADVGAPELEAGGPAMTWIVVVWIV